MKQSLSLKITFISVISILVAMTSGLISTYLVNNSLADYNANNRMLIAANSNSEDFENSLLVAETVVNSGKQIAENVLSVDVLGDDAKLENGLINIDSAFGAVAKPVNFLCTYWLVLEPSLCGVTQGKGIDGKGIFKVRPIDGNNFAPFPVTNILNFTEEDKENVIWWYTVKDSSKPIWLEPYYNANIDQNLVTYAVPIYENKTFLGVIGVDLQWNEILTYATDINGDFATAASAFLVGQDDHILYHEDNKGFDENGHFVGTSVTVESIVGQKSVALHDNKIHNYPYKGDSLTAIVITLRNGMDYGISAKTNVVFESSFLLTIVPLIVYLSVTVLLALALFFTVRYFFKPIKDLNEAVGAIRDGDLEVKIKPGRDDEIGELTESFVAMVTALKAERAAMSVLAFQDGLTGVKNKTAYDEKVNSINKAIAERKAEFAVIMCDVDNLKGVNDTLGHTSGDEAIRFACLSLCRAFVHSPVYRVGGDEFVAIAEGEDYLNRKELFKSIVGKRIGDKDYSYSLGMASFHQDEDKSFEEVFARADKKMYANKAMNKKGKTHKAKNAKEGKD